MYGKVNLLDVGMVQVQETKLDVLDSKLDLILLRLLVDVLGFVIFRSLYHRYQEA